MKSRVSWFSPRFAALLILPAIAVVVLGLVLTWETRAWTTERATENAADSAALVADMAIGPLMQQEDFSGTTISAERVAELDAGLQQFIGEDLVRIKIWDATGRVVYSDDASTVGASFPVSHELTDALAGEVSSEVSHLDKSENVSEEGFDRLLEVYVPLRVGSAGSTVGAFELYLPYEPIGDAISRDTRRIGLTLAAALAVLYVALLRVSVDWARSRRTAEDKAFEANHDPLTGLPNRRLFRSVLEEIARDGGDHDVAVMYLDLDDFKTVNDARGHAAGDELLTAVARRLSGAVRDDTTVARLGGDEFAVIVPRMGPGIEPSSIAARLIECLDAPVHLSSGTVNIDVSIGIEVARADELDPDEVQRHADNAMYMAKGAGKARHATFDPGLEDRLHGRVPAPDRA